MDDKLDKKVIEERKKTDAIFNVYDKDGKPRIIDGKVVEKEKKEK